MVVSTATSNDLAKSSSNSSTIWCCTVELRHGVGVGRAGPAGPEVRHVVGVDRAASSGPEVRHGVGVAGCVS